MRSRVLGLALAALLVTPAAGFAQMAGTPASPVAFWRAVGDTTLERLISRALATNPELHAADARVSAARAARTGAAFELAPIVTASSGYSRQRVSSSAVPGAAGPLPELGLWEAGVQVAWELDVFGRGRNTLQGRSALLGSAEEDVRDVQVLLAAEVARAYYQLLGARDRLAVAQRNAENQRRLLEVTRVRLEAGRGSAVDTERAQAQLSSTLAAVPALESAIAAAEHRLAVLLDTAPAALAGELGQAAEPAPLPRLPATPSADAALRARPDVRSSERRLAAQRAFVAAARADYLPRVSIGGMAGYAASSLESLGGSGARRYAIGPVVSWPLLDLGRVRSGVDQARAGEAEAAARHRQTLLHAAEEVETATVAYRKASERLYYLEEAAGASERATELARLRFDEGATDFLEVLDAERTQLEAQDRLATARAEALTWLVAVYRALGGAWPTTDPGAR